MGCKKGGLPSTYLGLPVGEKYKMKSILGWVRGENEKEACHVEEEIHIKRRKSNFNQDYVVQPTRLYDFYVKNAKINSQKVGKISRKLSLGRRK